MDQDSVVAEVPATPKGYTPSLHVLLKDLTRVQLEELSKIKIVTSNAEMSKVTDRTPHLRWKNGRGERLKKVILSHKPDIICLQELRSLPDTPSITSWLASFEEYRFELGYRNATATDWAKAILYNPKRFYCDRVLKRWLSDTPDVMSDNWTTPPPGSIASGYLVFMIHLLPVHEGKVVLDASGVWIVNVHLGMDETVKTKSCVKLMEIIDGVARKEPHYPFGVSMIIAGDFNFFPDKDGEKQRTILTRKGLADIGKHIRTGQERRFIPGTFVGYHHDEYKAVNSRNPSSRLDYIFGYGLVNHSNEVTALTETGMDPEPTPELSQPDLLPSDHLPIMADLSVNW